MRKSLINGTSSVLLAMALLLIAMLVPTLSFAYEAQEFTEELTFGYYTIAVPKGWTVQQASNDSTRTDIFDGSSKKAGQGVIVVFQHQYGPNVFFPLQEAGSILADVLKVKDYEIITVDGSPALCFTQTETLVTVKNTYVHKVHIIGAQTSFEVLFSTRGKDKELQEAEFRKLLATIKTNDQPGYALDDYPDLSFVFDKALTKEEIANKLETLLGISFETVEYTEYIEALGKELERKEIVQVKENAMFALPSTLMQIEAYFEEDGAGYNMSTPENEQWISAEGALIESEALLTLIGETFGEPSSATVEGLDYVNDGVEQSLETLPSTDTSDILAVIEKALEERAHDAYNITVAFDGKTSYPVNFTLYYYSFMGEECLFSYSIGAWKEY